MKRFVAFLVLHLYILTTFGVGLQIHYCGKKINSIKVVVTEQHDCSCGKGKMKPGCCKDDLKYLKVKSEHNGSSHVSTLNSFIFSELFFNRSMDLFSGFATASMQLALDRPPPNLSDLKIFQKNRSILI